MGTEVAEGLSGNTATATALTERDRFALGLMWRPGPDFNSWAEPCPCGNDGVCCDRIEDQ